ncbi:MAG: phosphoribosylformylglycinamidine cyclo-ligase [Candidatus Zixiibacteriota bacterium]
MSKEYTYKDSGVDLGHAETSTEKIARLAKSTFSKNVLTEIGSFGGIYKPPGMEGHVLVSSVDGVGTKIMIAADMNRYKTIGQDLVNHCVNDIAVMGAMPLFFLDYIGFADLSPDNIAEVVEGLTVACRKNNLSLIGGETAQMPGVYPEKQFDLVGAIVGVVAKNSIIDGIDIKPGDKIIAFPSSGLHTNGYSLARKVFEDDSWEDEIQGEKLGDMLLEIHRSYIREIGKISESIKIKGIAHITGGGIKGNLKRILPDDVSAIIRKDSIPKPKIFDIILKSGVAEEEMYNVFNMGFGMLVIIDSKDAENSIKVVESIGKTAFVCGEIVENEADKVILKS